MRNTSPNRRRGKRSISILLGFLGAGLAALFLWERDRDNGHMATPSAGSLEPEVMGDTVRLGALEEAEGSHVAADRKTLVSTAQPDQGVAIAKRSDAASPSMRGLRLLEILTVDTSGSPIPEVAIGIISGDTHTRSRSSLGRTDEAGRYDLRLSRELMREAENGGLAIEVLDPTGEPGECRVDLDRSREPLVLVLPPIGSVEFTLIDSTGNLAEEPCWVSLYEGDVDVPDDLTQSVLDCDDGHGRFQAVGLEALGRRDVDK